MESTVDGGTELRGGDGEHELPLFRLIDAVREGEASIRTRVEEHRARLAESTGLVGLPLAERLAEELVDDAALRSALIGSTAALPITLPVIGFWGSLALALSGGALFQLATEVDLVYAIASAYRSRLPPERLRVVSFWLVRLTNYDDLQALALRMGVRVTVRKLVEKLVAVGVARAIGATATGMMGGMMGRSVAASPAPLAVRATGLLGVPVLACFGWRSTRAVGDRARAYFYEELTQP